MDIIHKQLDFIFDLLYYMYKKRGDMMYRQCKSERAAKRQHELEQGLLSLMTVRRYDEISVTHICDQMSIPRKSFYRYFSGKDGALEALIDHSLMGYESFTASVRTGEKRTIQGELETFFEFFRREKVLMDAMERNGLSAMLIQRCITNATLNNALPPRLLDREADQNRVSVTMFAISGLMALVLRWHHNGYVEPVAQMAETAVRLLTHPLFPDVEEML